MSNFKGEFEIELKGTKRKMKATFEVIDKLESTTFADSSVTRVFFNAAAGNVKFNVLTDVIYLGLCGAKDTRLSRDEVGQAIIEGGGLNHYLPIYIAFLQHFMDGGRKADKSNPL